MCAAERNVNIFFPSVMFFVLSFRCLSDYNGYAVFSLPTINGNFRQPIVAAFLNILYTVFGEISILTEISLKLTQKYEEKVFGKYMQIRVAIQFCRRTDNKIFPISRHLQKRKKPSVLQKNVCLTEGVSFAGALFCLFRYNIFRKIFNGFPIRIFCGKPTATLAFFVLICSIYYTKEEKGERECRILQEKRSRIHL